MRALRKLGIVHRDLKPTTILVEEKPVASNQPARKSSKTEDELPKKTRLVYKIADLGTNNLSQTPICIGA